MPPERVIEGVHLGEVSSTVPTGDGALSKPGSNGGLAGAEPPSPGVSHAGVSHAAEVPGSPRPEVAAHLLDLIGEGVALATRTGRLVSANEFVRRLGGAMLERMAGACRQFDRDHPSLPPGAPRGAVRRSEVVLAEGDKWYDLAISTGEDLREADAGVEDLVLVLRDVSGQRRLQQKINAIDQAGAELVRLDPEMVRRYNAHERLKLLETKIVRVAHDLLHFDHFAIRLLDERSGKLELVIGCNLPQEFDSFVIRPALEGHGISGYVAASGRSYVCSEASSDALYLPGVEGARSSLTVPLRLHDKVIGIMNVESLRQAAFSEEDRQLAEIFARSIAMALHMLDLLVVERSTTNQSITGRVATELKEPIEDIAHEVEVLRAELPANDPSARAHLERITMDLAAIKERLQECAAGPASLLGVEKALSHKGPDPLLQGKRVLIADDEPRIRKTIGDVLSVRGAWVELCENGGKAVTALEAAGPGGYDLVISDIRMPDRNGYEVFAASKKMSPEASVILMTGFGYDPHHSIVRASQEGLQTVLFKPFQVERLLDEVKKALTKKA